MRRPDSNKEETHKKILEVAGRLFRERGYNGVGIDAVMAEAGLTAGAFYFHFSSKEALFSEAITHTLEARRSSLKKSDQPEADGLQSLIKGYLSRAHRDDVASGCAFPSLTPDMSRAGQAARASFERQISKFVAAVEEKLSDDDEQHREHAVAIVAQLIGGVMLARAVPGKDFSDQILLACRRAALEIGGDGIGREAKATRNIRGRKGKKLGKSQPLQKGQRGGADSN